MAIERLTASDELMLWPEDRWPQHIGALVILEGSDLFDRESWFRIDAVREAIASRLHLVPRFRQLLRIPPRSLGRPLWIDAPGFDIRDHVRAIEIAAPHDERQLLLTVEHLRQRPLDRSRPLWEMWFLTGMPGHRVGLLVKLHHAIADGVAGVATMGAFLDVDPDAAVPVPEPWTPAPPPSAHQLRADNRQRRAAAVARAEQAAVHPLRTLRRLRDAWPALREFVAEKELPATSLDALVGPRRTFALVRGSLDELKDVAHAHDATVNDVLLEAITGALRSLLVSRGERVDGMVMRVDVPISFRLDARAHAPGNRIGEMVVPLPVDIVDPLRRLRWIALETARRKARTRPAIGVFPHRGALGKTMLRLIDRQHVNVASTNVPGPPVPVHLAGARVLEVFPLLPLLGKQAIGVAAISYAGQFNIMVVADADTCPDLDVFAAAMRDQVRALSALAHAASRQTPAGAAARAAGSRDPAALSSRAMPAAHASISAQSRKSPSMNSFRDAGSDAIMR